jgi:glycerol uptake facilitator protein
VRGPLPRALVAECVGTYLLVLFGTGSVAAAVLTGAQVGLWQVAVVWGFGVALAIYATAAASGAHLNPAVSLAFAVCRPRAFPRARLGPYWLAQLAGAVLAGATVAAAFWPFLVKFEAEKHLVRGQPGSELAAMVFGEYFPNPALFGTDVAAQALVSLPVATLVEGFGTAVLVFVIFALTDPDNAAAPGTDLAPFFVGFTVAVLISLFAPITQAGWNPARDLGPRLVALALGGGRSRSRGPAGASWPTSSGRSPAAPSARGCTRPCSGPGRPRRPRRRGCHSRTRPPPGRPAGRRRRGVTGPGPGAADAAERGRCPPA